jgi:hypothetical protein
LWRRLFRRQQPLWRRQQLLFLDLDSDPLILLLQQLEKAAQ